MELSYDDQLLLLDRIVSDGLEKLLNEARENKHLEEPYGRNTEPTPLISEEDFVKAGGLTGCLPDEPDFNFHYGFNPLSYLSKFISWSHPSSVEARRQEKLRAVERLTSRAIHARAQLDTAAVLQDKVQQFSSGIYWGPFVSPIPYKEDPFRNLNDSVTVAPTCSVIVMCKSLKGGFVTLQLSQDESFSAIVASKTSAVAVRRVIEDESPEGGVCLEDIQPVKALFAGLQFGTRYFVRGYLSDVDDSIPTAPPQYTDDGDLIEAEVVHAEVPFSQASSFWTLPSEDVVLPAGFQPTDDIPSAPLSLVCFGQLPNAGGGLHAVHSEESVPLTAADSGPLYSALLSDLMYANRGLPTHCRTAPTSSTAGALHDRSLADNRASSLYARSALFNSGAASVLRRSSALIANRDSSEGARGFVLSEEIVHKQFRHDLRRYNKKYPPAGAPPSKSSRSSSKTQPAPAAAAAAAGGAAPVPVVPPPPTLKRLPLAESVQSLLELFPVDFTEDYDPRIPSAAELAKVKDKNQLKALKEPVILGARMLYRSVMLGPDVQVLVLDTRGAPDEGGAGYLGKEQAAWLTHQLSESSCLWKVVLCGYSGGVVGISDGTRTVQPSRPTTAPASEASAPLATTSGDAGDEQPERTSKSKKIQLPDEAEKPAVQRADEDVDELYSRSKYSLPYVLAKVQKKFGVPTAPSSEEQLQEGQASGEVMLTSGIVLLTSGVCRVVKPGSAVAVPHPRDNPQEALSPAFVAAYATLTGTPSEEYGELFPVAAPAAAYCVEVGLGSSSSRRQEGVAGFGVMAGFESSALFVAPTGDDEAPASAAATLCRLNLTTEGALSVALIAASASSETGSAENTSDVSVRGRVVFECLLRTSLPEAPSVEEGGDDSTVAAEAAAEQ